MRRTTGNGMNHDQNFKNLILDYPRQALEFFAAAEAGALEGETARITPVRQEQLQERLGERFRELDTPLLEEPVMDSLEFNVPTTVENAFLVELLNVSELLAASYWLDCTL